MLSLDHGCDLKQTYPGISRDISVYYLQLDERYDADHVRLCHHYATELVLALEHLHFLNIANRGLQPENALECFDKYDEVRFFCYTDSALRSSH